MKCKDCLFYVKEKQADSSDAMVCLHDHKKRWLIDGCSKGKQKILERQIAPPYFKQNASLNRI